MAIVEYMEVIDIRNVTSASRRSVSCVGGRDAGLITMRDSALDHVIEGLIPLSELPRILPRERMHRKSVVVEGVTDEQTTVKAPSGASGVTYREELDKLVAMDQGPVPPGWKMRPGRWRSSCGR